MTLIFNGHSFKYEIESLCRSFFPPGKLALEYDTRPSGGDYIFTRRRKGSFATLLYTLASMGGRRARCAARIVNDAPQYEKECERLLAVTLYTALQALTGLAPKWGILTGVRPVKLLSRLDARYAQSAYLVTPQKLALAARVALAEAPILAMNTPEAYSLYVSIPFCPTRCSYCSFVSESVEKARRLIPDYLELLKREIAVTGEIAGRLGLTLKSVYFGGGTPTTLSAEQLAGLMGAVAKSFPVSGAMEYTVEAGRPDTIDAGKLAAIKAGGATRISINPQTMSDSVLSHIGRSHTAARTGEAYLAAREAGFGNINMDIIAGLPTDTVEGFADTLDKVLAFNPESITVHTLTLKRSSTLFRDEAQRGAIGTVSDMVELSQRRILASGYTPYYLYRQKNITGSLENVGYAKPGAEGFYNVWHMSEAHTILSVGAGAITKLVANGGREIKRIANHKYPVDYIGSFDTFLARKEEIAQFYCNCR